jgi:hypothetical protein
MESKTRQLGDLANSGYGSLLAKQESSRLVDALQNIINWFQGHINKPLGGINQAYQFEPDSGLIPLLQTYCEQKALVLDQNSTVDIAATKQLFQHTNFGRQLSLQAPRVPITKPQPFVYRAHDLANKEQSTAWGRLFNCFANYEYCHTCCSCRVPGRAGNLNRGCPACNCCYHCPCQSLNCLPGVFNTLGRAVNRTYLSCSSSLSYSLQKIPGANIALDCLRGVLSIGSIAAAIYAVGSDKVNAHFDRQDFAAEPEYIQNLFRAYQEYNIPLNTSEMLWTQILRENAMAAQNRATYQQGTQLTTLAAAFACLCFFLMNQKVNRQSTFNALMNVLEIDFNLTFNLTHQHGFVEVPLRPSVQSMTDNLRDNLNDD